MKFCCVLSASLALVAATPAFAAVLTNGTADGQVTVDVSAFGSMGSGNGLYNPVGSGNAATTIYGSRLYFRNGTTGARDALDIGTIVSFSGTDTARTSVFTVGDLSVTLTQTLTGLFDGGNQTGSLLTQAYTFSNLGRSNAALDLVRYIDGDLNFDGNLIDGGGRVVSNGSNLLFEIDTATGASTSATFLGLYNSGGTANGYQIAQYSTLANLIANGSALNNTIAGDGNNDGFIDAGAGYDVAIALGSVLNVAAGSTGTFTTNTVFGTGLPGTVVVPPSGVPEPASWAMMVGGFGLIGGALRRRKSAVSFA